MLSSVAQSCPTRVVHGTRLNNLWDTLRSLSHHIRAVDLPPLVDTFSLTALCAGCCEVLPRFPLSKKELGPAVGGKAAGGDPCATGRLGTTGNTGREGRSQWQPLRGDQHTQTPDAAALPPADGASAALTPAARRAAASPRVSPPLLPRPFRRCKASCAPTAVCFPGNLIWNSLVPHPSARGLLRVR